MPKIELIDVTNRDGEQTARISLSKLQKTIINWLLDQFGVYHSEMGFPLSPHERNYINANIALTRPTEDNGEPLLKRIQLGGWSRALASDVEKALAQTDLEHLNLSISTSEQMLKWKFRGKFSREDIIKMMVDSVVAAKERGVKTAGINAEDASRTDLNFLIEFALAGKEVGADRFRYCDTLGYDDPVSIAERVSTIARETQMPIELHCHNDLGLAVANSTLKHSARWGASGLLTDAIDLSKAWQLANYVAKAFNLPIPINQVGVGANAFAHESGIHADGALKDRHNYELYAFEDLGRPDKEMQEVGRVITTGIHGGASHHHGYSWRYIRPRVRLQPDGLGPAGR